MSIGVYTSNQQREIAELEDYIKSIGHDFKNKSLVTDSGGETVESIKARLDAHLGEKIQLSEEKVNEIKSISSSASLKEGVKVEISEAGRVRAANSEELKQSQLFEIMSNSKELHSYYPEYEDALEKESTGFKKAYATQTIGKYVDSGIKTDEVDLSYVERLNALYDKLREEIKGVSDEEEQNARMKSLDDSYNRVFGKNIVNPLKSQYDGQESFYQTGVQRKDSQMEASYNGLKEAKGLYDALLNNANWHNTNYMKDIIGKLTDAIVANAKSR